MERLSHNHRYRASLGVVIGSWVPDESNQTQSRPGLVDLHLVDEFSNETVLEVYIDGDVARLRGITISGDHMDPKMLTSLARQLPRLLAKVVESAQIVTAEQPPSGGLRDEIAMAGRRRRTRLTDKFLGEVADVYRANDGIVEAVRRHFDLTQRTAYRYVTAAKDRGFITEEDT